ncbi:DUF423 domain-containing protein [Persicobacter diffluens]|uniref:DUF423 domain-containing protein n=1 Tax=Persicobacter diffluens TaxID=981 RepID=A0AAN5AKT3_9BACT|nr:DUF423 domain-containing protein [Persicobacter diffluens]
MQKLILTTAAALGALTVMIGAFGAHGLQSILQTHGRVDTFETAVKYQMYHVMLMMILGLLYPKISGNLAHYSFYANIFGMLVFSGSLYALCLTNISKLGAITPFGGMGFIAAWLLFAIACWQKL